VPASSDLTASQVAAPETARIVGLRPAGVALVIALLVAAAAYFSWRLTTFNPDALILSYVVYAAELFGLFAVALHLFMTTRLVERTPAPPLDNVTVDIFVTTYNEPVSMLRRTLVAAKLVRRATRVVLLDDGNRAEMKALAAELGVDYLARETNLHAKAGNLNNALEHSTADFIATFDADHAPAPDFLDQTLGYFRHQHVAFVQTPQEFYNLDSFQHRRFGKTNRFWTEQSLFFRVIQPGKDRWNAAFFCGSCAVLRRWALNRVGGFATGTVTEDLHTSIKLHKAGFESVYHSQSLAFGVAPSSFEPYESQRVRWGKGAMQVWKQEGLLFASGLTLAQRFCYLASVITYFDAWQKVVFYALPAFVLLTAIMPMAGIGWEFAAFFLPYFVLSLLVCEEVGRGYARSWTIEQYNFLRTPAFLSASLSLFFPADAHFKVTRKAGIKAGSSRDKLAWMALVPLVSLAAIPFAVWRYMSDAGLPLGALVANAFWALLTAAITIAALRFAWVRTGDRRADYRFAAPFPFDVHLPSGGWGTLRAIDMTSDGVRLAAPMGLDFSVGRKLDAILRLPGGPARVSIRVRSRQMVMDDALPQRMELGCKLEFENPVDQDRLNAVLYGAGLERRLLDMVEHGATPVDMIDAEANAPLIHDVRRAWAPGAIAANDNEFDVAAQPLTDAFDRWRVVSYQPLPQEAFMRLPTKTGKHLNGAHMRVIKSQEIPAADSSLFLSDVELTDVIPLPLKKKGGVEPWLLATASVLAVGVMLVTTAAVARGETIGLAGVEGGSNSSYAYAGVVAPLPGQGEHEGWAARVWGDRLTYSYDLNGTNVEAEAYGGELALVHRWSGEWGYANASVGARYRSTDLTPDDAGNPAEGSQWDANLQFDGRAAMHERWALVWLAAREIDQGSSIVRLGADRDMNGWRLGADATRLWGERHGETQAGLIAQWRLRNGATLGARAGATRNDDGDQGGYAGLGIAFAWN
jgi:cellulose synthase (UDP-forming)